MDRAAPADTCRSWKPDLEGVTEVLHADFTTHAYPLRCHDVWTVLLVDAGAVRYGIDRHHRAADPATVTVLPPFVAHDGQSATDDAARRRCNPSASPRLRPPRSMPSAESTPFAA